MKKLLLLLCACSPLVAMQDDDAPLAPPLYQQLLQHGIKILHADPTLPPIRCKQLKNFSMYFHFEGKQIYASPKFLRYSSYEAIKGTILHEIVHTMQPAEFGNLEAIDPLRFPRGAEQEADTLAIVSIDCPQCADEWVQRRPMQHPVNSWQPTALLRNRWYRETCDQQQALLQEGYLSYEEACKIAQEKVHNPLCGYHQALADSKWYCTPLMRFFIKRKIEQRVASGELEP